jgi:hypothetical protein
MVRWSRTASIGLLLAALTVGGCDVPPAARPPAEPSTTSASVATDEQPPAWAVRGKKPRRLALRYGVLRQLRLEAHDDGVIERREAIALAIGTRSLRLKRVVATLEGVEWQVVLLLRNGCHSYAILDALTGRASSGGYNC